MQVEIRDFKPMAAGALRGIFDAVLPSGMVLHGCCVFSKGGRAWVMAPSKPLMARDGVALRGPDGKAGYAPAVSFVDRATQDRWSGAVIEAVRAVYPEALT